MKEILEIVINNIFYIYPGFIVIYVYQYLKGNKIENIELFFLKDVCISYIMVSIIDNFLGIIFETEFSEAKIVILKHILSLVLSLVIAFLAYNINKSKLLEKVFKRNNIPISTCKSDIEIIERKCPNNCVVYITLYMQNIIISGILKEAETENDGFLLIKFWNKYSINQKNKIRKITNKRICDENVVIKMNQIIYYSYQYIGKNDKLPMLLIE